MASADIRGLEVWAVVAADPKSDEEGYLAFTEIFAEREDARRALRRSAEQDAECFNEGIRWYDRDTDGEWCQVLCGGEPRTTYCLEPLKIR